MKVVKWDHFNYNWEKDGVAKQPEVWDTKHSYREMTNAIIDSIKEHGYKFDGSYHQYGKMGCPVLDDGSYCTFSMRGWGEIMYDAWDDDGDGMGYCKYAWRYEDSDVKTPEDDLKTKEK